MDKIWTLLGGKGDYSSTKKNWVGIVPFLGSIFFVECGLLKLNCNILFQALGECARSKKRADDERGLGSRFRDLPDPARRPQAFLFVSTLREPKTGRTVEVAEYHVTDDFQFMSCAKHSQLPRFEVFLGEIHEICKHKIPYGEIDRAHK